MKRAARNQERKLGASRLGMLAAVVLLVATATTWSQEPPKPATEPAPAAAEKKPDAPPPEEKAPAQTPAPASSTTTPAPAGTTPASTENAAEEDAHAPERFIPTQKSSADNSATFPIDI